MDLGDAGMEIGEGDHLDSLLMLVESSQLKNCMDNPIIYCLLAVEENIIFLKKYS